MLSPLAHACAARSVALVELLLERGAARQPFHGARAGCARQADREAGAVTASGGGTVARVAPLVEAPLAVHGRARSPTVSTPTARAASPSASDRGARAS